MKSYEDMNGVCSGFRFIVKERLSQWSVQKDTEKTRVYRGWQIHIMYVRRYVYVRSPKDLWDAPSPLGSRCSISQESTMLIKYATYVPRYRFRAQCIQQASI